MQVLAPDIVRVRPELSDPEGHELLELRGVPRRHVHHLLRHVHLEEPGDVEEDAEEDDGEDELEEAEGGGAVLLSQVVAVRLADRRVPAQYTPDIFLNFFFKLFSLINHLLDYW